MPHCQQPSRARADRRRRGSVSRGLFSVVLESEQLLWFFHSDARLMDSDRSRTDLVPPAGQMGLDSKEPTTIAEASEFARVSRRTMYSWINTGKVQTVRIAGGSQRILRSSIFAAVPTPRAQAGETLLLPQSLVSLESHEAGNISRQRRTDVAASEIDRHARSESLTEQG